MSILQEAPAHSDPKRWGVIYPAYIDAKKTREQGRKIPKGKAVEDPKIMEIQEILAAAGVNPVLERNKMYPREQDREPDSQGRVRIQLKNDDGSVKYPQFPSRQSLFVYVADMIPKLKTRQPGYVATPATAAAGGKKNKKKK